MAIWNLALKKNRGLFSGEHNCLEKNLYRDQNETVVRWKLVAYISEQAAAAHQPMYQLTFLEPKQNTNPAPSEVQNKKKENLHQLSSCCHTHLMGRMCKPNVVCREGRYNLALGFGMVMVSSTRYQKLLSIMGGFFSMFTQSATGRKLLFYNKRDIWPSAQSGWWNYFFFRQKGYKIKTGALTRTLKRKYLRTYLFITANDLLWYLIWQSSLWGANDECLNYKPQTKKSINISGYVLSSLDDVSCWITWHYLCHIETLRNLVNWVG